MKKLFVLLSGICIICIGTPCFSAVNTWGPGLFLGSSDWNTASNWSLGRVPLSTDDVSIPANFHQPLVSGTPAAVCRSITVDAVNGISLTVDGTLTVSGTGAGAGLILQNPPTGSLLGIGGTVVNTLAGAGTINCASVQVGNNSLLNLGIVTVNQTSLISTVNNLQISGDVNIFSSTSAVLGISLLQNNNSAFFVQGGTTTIGGQIFTTTALSTGISITLFGVATANFYVDVPVASALNPRLVLTSANPIKTGSNVGSIDFYSNSGTGARTGICTIEYAAGTGVAQTVYSVNQTLLDISPSAYQNISFSGGGVKTVPDNGNVTIARNWNSAGGKVDLVTNSPTVVFQGTTQTLTDGGSDGSKGVVFKYVTFQGGGTKTISSGNFAVNDVGLLTVTASSTLAAGGNLTLQSDVTGSASVAVMPAGSAVTGNVNVQRFVQGTSNGLGGTAVPSRRNYRLMSSPVSTSINASGFSNEALNPGAGTYAFDLRYILAGTLVNGNSTYNYDKAGNPTLYFYRNDFGPSYNTFTGGPFKGVTQISASTPFKTDIGEITNTLAYAIIPTPLSVQVPLGNGFMVFYRGNRTSNTTTKLSTAGGSVIDDATFTATGILNQGNITVQHWTKAGTASGQLIYTAVTTPATTSTRLGFNLVGNPYASTLNWDNFLLGSSTSNIRGTNISKTIYVLDPVTKNYSAYISTGAQGLNAVNNSTVSANVSGNATNMITSGQGFYVVATGSSPTLTFTEAAKAYSTTLFTSLGGGKILMDVPQNNDALTFNTAPVATADDNPSWMRIKLIADSINTDDISISFADNASAGYVLDEDAYDFGGNGAGVALSSYSDDAVPLAINKEPGIAGVKKIRLDVSGTASGLLTLSVPIKKNIDPRYNIYLMDYKLKDSLDIIANQDYAFTIDRADTSSFGANRFALIISPKAAMYLHLLNFAAVKDQQTVKTTWLVENEYDKTIFYLERSINNGQSFESLGKITSSGISNYTFTDKSPGKGLNTYRLRFNYMDGRTGYSKNITINYGQLNGLANNLNVFPNPTTSSINFMMPPDNKGNIPFYNVKIINSSGSVIKKTDSSAAHWQNDVSSLLPGTYIIQVMNNADKSVWGVSKFVKQ